MKKYTHKALLALLALFFGMMTVSALLLKKEVAVTDLKDPDRGYERIALPPFKYVYAQYGPEKELDPQRNDYDVNTIEIAASDADQILINKHEKDSIRWKISQDTLYILGSDPNIFWNPVVKLKCAHLLGVKANMTAIDIHGYQRDQLSVQVLNFARLDMYDSQVNQLQVDAKDHSVVNFNTLNVNQLQVNIRDTSQLKMNDTRPAIFQLTNDQTALVQLQGSSLQYVVVK